MSMLQEAETAAPGRAAAARLLAAWWSRPTAEELGRWAGGWEAAYAAADALAAPRTAVEELETALDQASPEALLEEHERLLVGPGRAPCPPYESLWRSDAPRREQGSLMGRAATDVARIYGELGLQMRSGAGELPDHLAVEWEALAFALEQGVGEAASALLDDHLSQWMASFCVAVSAATTQPFYAALARLTAGWTEALGA